VEGYLKEGRGIQGVIREKSSKRDLWEKGPADIGWKAASRFLEKGGYSAEGWGAAALVRALFKRKKESGDSRSVSSLKASTIP